MTPRFSLKAVFVMLAVVLAIVAQARCDDVNNGLPQKVADLQAQVAAQQQQLTALQTQVSTLQGQLTALGSQVASFYNAADKSISATAFILPSGWKLWMEGNVFVIRQQFLPIDYRYAFYPNRFRDV